MGKRTVMRAVAMAATMLVIGASSAMACGGLVAPNGSIALTRTTTMAGYRNGIEHYVTAFEFAGQAKELGSIVPLPGLPTRVIRGGDWTLQRLEQEVAPAIAEGDVLRAASASPQAAEDARVVLRTTIDALDVVILEGGGDAVGRWAKEHGFQLPPDAPEVLDFYASRSPYFMAARFDGEAAGALGQGVGDSTPVHLVIPTDRPWVPLRILALGQDSGAVVEADVFLLTGNEPNLLPAPLAPSTDADRAPGIVLERSEQGSDLLISDLRSDAHMKWVDADGMWLSFMKIDAEAGDLVHDLAIDPTGSGEPSRVDAGFASLIDPPPAAPDGLNAWLLAAGGVVIVTIGAGMRSRRRHGGRGAVA